MGEEKTSEKFTLGLLGRIILALILGIIVGQMTFLPTFVLEIFVTLSSLFGSVLNFFIPLMVVAFIVKGISDLNEGAGKLLGITTGISYLSTIVFGFLAYFIAANAFPNFIDNQVMTSIGQAREPLQALFDIPIEPMFSVTAAIVFSFMVGLSISHIRHKYKDNYLYNIFTEFEKVVNLVLEHFIIPLIPLFIFGNFINLSYTGEIAAIFSVFWRVIIVIIALHLFGIFIWFLFAGSLGKKNPFILIKNQIPGYLTALGTQSSAATIPVNLGIAERNGVSKEIRDFVVPFCATAHLMGSIITIVSSVVAVLIMYDMPYGFSNIFGFVLILGVAMVAAPGAPGGAIMSALPFLAIVGIAPNSTLANLLITLYLTIDSFGTAANVSGDNAIAIVVDEIYKKYILKAS